MNEKGSIKDRLKTWYFYLKKKRELLKKQKKLEQERISLYYKQNNLKYYSKPKVISLTFLGLFLALFENTTKEEKIDLSKSYSLKIIKKDDKEIDELIHSLKQIEKKLDKYIINKIEKVKEIELTEEIEKIILKADMANNKLDNLEKKYDTKSTDKKVFASNVVKVDFIKEKIEVAKEKNKSIKNKIEKLNTDKIKNNEIKEKRELKKDISEINILKNEEFTLINKEIVLVGASSKKELLETSESILEILNQDPNKKLKEALKKIENELKKNIYKEEFEQKLKDIEKLEELNHNYISIDNEIKIKKLKEKTNKKIEEIDNLKKKQKQDKKDFETVIKFNEKIKFAKTSQELALIKEEVDDFIFTNEKNLSKNNLYKLKEIGANIYIKSDKIKKKTVKKTEDELAEIVLMEVYMYNKLKTQKKEVTKFKEKMDILAPEKRKKGFLRGFGVFINRTIKLAFSLFPLFLFKNKKLGFLASAVLVNNSIRGMRNMVNKKEIPFIEHNTLSKQIKQGQDAVEKSYDICYDSLEQIEKLKNDFVLEVGYENNPEIDNVMGQMNQLENMIKSRINELNITNENFKTIEKDIKIKKLERKSENH